MAQSMVTFQMDEALKAKMETVCSDMGITPSAAYTIFATKVVREHRIPFEISADPFYNEANLTFLQEAVNALNQGKGVAHELIETD